MFPIASMTKPIVAACALTQWAEGALDLSAPVSDFIPEFGAERIVRTLRPGQQYRFERFPAPPATDEVVEPEFDYAPAARAITVHDLLSFTSGLQTIGIANPAIPLVDPADNLADWVAKLGAVPLEFQPGTRWHYSNATGYDVLGRVVEVVGGRPLAEYVDDLLFAPLGMQHTGFGLRPGTEQRTIPLGLFTDSHISRPSYHSGSAGVFSTAVDYARFVEMLVYSGEFRGRRIIPAEAVAAMTENHIGSVPFPGIRTVQYAQPFAAESQPGFHYGYGVAAVDSPSDDVALPAGSFGWDGIGTRRFWAIPSLRTALVMLVPGLGPLADATHRDIEALVADNAA